MDFFITIIHELWPPCLKMSVYCTQVYYPAASEIKFWRWVFCSQSKCWNGEIALWSDLPCSSPRRLCSSACRAIRISEVPALRRCSLYSSRVSASRDKTREGTSCDCGERRNRTKCHSFLVWFGTQLSLVAN